MVFNTDSSRVTQQKNPSWKKRNKKNTQTQRHRGEENVAVENTRFGRTGMRSTLKAPIQARFCYKRLLRIKKLGEKLACMKLLKACVLGARAAVTWNCEPFQHLIDVLSVHTRVRCTWRVHTRTWCKCAPLRTTAHDGVVWCKHTC